MTLTIAIAGAGIGGLATAALLAARGYAVTVFDRFDKPAPVGSGLVIQPVGLAVLGRCGAAEAALASGARIHRMLGLEARTGARVLDVAYGPEGGDRFGLAIHRASLFQALLDAALAKGAAIVPSAAVTEAPLDGPARLIRVGETTHGPYDLVVDAAGTGSPLSPLKGRPLPYGALWATVPWPDTGIPANRLSQRYRAASRMAGVLPVGRLPGGTAPQAAVFWSLPATAEPAFRATPLATWKAEATALWPAIAPFLAPIASHDALTMARYTHGSLRRPFAERLVHLGDAAHRASPQLGQGANMALLDALALDGALAAHDLRAALPAWAAARRPHIAVYQGLSAAFTPQYQSDSTWLPVLRDRALAPLSRMWPLPPVLTRLVSGDLVPPIRFGLGE